jgi:hypothetical protein
MIKIHNEPNQFFDATSQIWRYMDFWKFEDLLEKGELFFTRLKVFEDRYEGSNPVFVPALREQYLRTQGGDVERYRRESEWALDWGRTRTLANSWHERTYESDPMWRLYCTEGKGVAIVSTMGQLRSVLPAFPQFEVRRVKYIDFTEAQEYSSNPFGLALLKGHEFEDEREVRAARTDWPGKEMGPTEAEAPVGYSVAVDPSAFINSVVVSPRIAERLGEVESLVRAHGLDVPACPSSLSRVRYF